MEAVEFGTSAIDGIIEIPTEYRRDFSTGLRVILIKDVPQPTNAKQQDIDMQERLAAAKRLVGIAEKNPLSLEEIRNERLARQ
jgi:hypothetical protein